MPEAFINLLALMGWNDGSGQEVFTKEELISKFSMERVHSAGAQFDFEKAKWFNHEWIKRSSAERLLPDVKSVLHAKGLNTGSDGTLKHVIELVKERCILLNDFNEQAGFFFSSPASIDTDSIKGKWNAQKQLFFTELMRNYELTALWHAADLEKAFKEIAAVHEIKPGELMLPFRIMLVGGKFGPGVFDIAETIGKTETVVRIKHALSLL
jgi:glutamyl-tRNA synthetase